MSSVDTSAQTILKNRGVEADAARIVLATDMGDKRALKWDESALTFVAEALSGVMSYMHRDGIADLAYVTDVESGFLEVYSSNLSDIVQSRHPRTGNIDMGDLLDVLATVYRATRKKIPMIVFVLCDGSGSDTANRLHRAVVSISDLPIFVSFVTHSSDIQSFRLQRFIASELNNAPAARTGASFTHIPPDETLDDGQQILEDMLDDAAVWLRTLYADKTDDTKESLLEEVAEELAEEGFGALLGRALAGLSRFTHRVADKVDDLMERYSDTVD